MALENNKFSREISLQKQGDNFDIQAILAKGLQYWWLFILFVIISVLGSYLYLRYSTPQYKIAAKILVKDTKKGGSGASSTQMFEELGLLGGANSVDNEVELLKSRTLMENTVADQQLNVRYFAAGKIKQTEVFFKKVPFTLTLFDLEKDSLTTNVNLFFHSVNDTQFNLKYDEKEHLLNYGDTISFYFGKIFFRNNRGIKEKDVNYNIFIDPADNTVSSFKEKLNVVVTNKTVSTIDLTLIDPVPARGELLLTTLLQIYNRMNTEDKNRVADSTIAFIDNRLVFVTRELGSVERNIQTFRQQNELTDLSAQGKLLLENSSDYLKELSKTEVQISIINSLQNYLTSEQNTSRTIPAGLVIEDPTFASMVEKYNTLQLEKERQLQTTTEGNPIVQRLSVQIANLKGDIVANLSTIKRTMEITRSQLKGRTNSFESQIQQVPRKERAFLEISRQQAIKQELYVYLLKKREETAVSKAANIDNARIVDNAKSETTPISPNRRMVYLSALFIGLLLPSAIIYVQSLLNNKVESKKDITNATTVPIVGEIGRSLDKNNFIVKDNPRQPVAEQLRLLRTNLNFMLPGASGSRVIMLTSSMSGEGKSFLSLNLAAMLAYGGKKVVLLEFDLRKPKLSKYLNVENVNGLTSFLINKITDIHSITKEIAGMENLYFINSGEIPPNPAELISSEQSKILFAQLKTRFDYIVLDVPPVGVVADALLLSTYSDISLYVVRQNYTLKNQLELVDDLYLNKKFKNLGIIVNDIKRQKGYGYGYASGYGYGYSET